MVQAVHWAVGTAAEASSDNATPAESQAKKAGDPVENKTDAPASSSEFGLMREFEELGVHRSLDREQLQRGRSGHEPLAQRKAGDKFKLGRNLIKGVMVEGPSAEVNALIVGMKARPDLFRRVVNQTLATSEIAPAGDATIQKQAPPSDALGVSRDDAGKAKLEGVEKAVPFDSPTTPPDGKPALAPRVPTARKAGELTDAAKESRRTEPDRPMESTRAKRGAERLRDLRRKGIPAEQPNNPPPAPQPAPSRGLVESSPSLAEKKAEAKSAQPAPAAAAPMLPAPVKPQDPAPRQAVGPAASAPRDSGPVNSESQAQQTPAVLYGRAQEVMVPEGVLGDRESAEQKGFDTLDAEASKRTARDQSQLGRFAKTPGQKIPGKTAVPSAVEIDTKIIDEPTDKSEPAALGKIRERAKRAVAGEETDANKAAGDGQGKGENAETRAREMPLRLGEGKQRRGKDQAGEKNPSADEKLDDAKPREAAAASNEVYDSRSRQAIAAAPAQRRVIFVFNVQSSGEQPPAAAAPIKEAAPTPPAKPD